METTPLKSSFGYMVISLLLCGAAFAAGFDFNDGTVQGWILQGAYDEDGDGPFSNNFSATFSWKDPVNYPGIPGSDSIGNNIGSLQMFGGLHGINNPGAEWWIMQFYSPDLSSDVDWQNAHGFTVQIAECMTIDLTGSQLYANLYVVAYDHDLGYNRYFYNGSAEVLQHCVYGSENIWNLETLDWSAIGSFPSHYTIKNVFINIWGKMSDGYQGGLYIDEVQPFGAPAAPTDVETTVISPQIHVTWQDNAFNETGYKVQYKRWYRYDIGGEPSTWTDGPTLGENCTSYQHDSATYNYYYKFRVCATNSYGDSDWSDEVQVLVGHYLYWISITHPNGGENLAVGANREITWNSSSGIPTVTIDYSTDGGSTWRTPAIAAGTANDGSYLWTVPDTLSDACVLRIRDASDGWPYDLSNTPFSIVPAAPDLVVQSVTVTPEKPVRGQSCLMEIVVKNQGSVNASGFWVDWFAHLDTPPTPGMYASQYAWVADLAAGATTNVSFNTTYPQPGDFTAYVLLDTSEQVSEADEDNNVHGPTAVEVIIKGELLPFDTRAETSDASKWFGGDDRPGMTRNVGAGQSIILAREARVQSAAFRFATGFDYYQNPDGFGHAVRLYLNVRNQAGAILRTVYTDLPSSFSGGWASFTFGSTELWLSANQNYIFTCYLGNGENLKLTSIILGNASDPWPLCDGYSAAVSGTPADMENWSNWAVHPYDFNFHITGQYVEPYPGDLNSDWTVGIDDAAILAGDWLRDDCLMLDWCDGCDIDWSKKVDLADFAVLSAYWNKSFSPPSYSDLNRDIIANIDQHGHLSSVPIDGSNGSEFKPGSYFVYRTSQGRLGKCIVENWEPASSYRLTIAWVTYHSDGTIYSTGTGLVIRGTFSCDLDSGTETSAGADFWWNIQNSTTRYLTPQNSALFKLMYRAP